ncbi:MAG: hypothetical protein HC853_13785 [Anaerolineae bacterium]|nr:hypothetical protein [Anaerolineae bacterium]
MARPWVAAAFAFLALSERDAAIATLVTVVVQGATLVCLYRADQPSDTD